MKNTILIPRARLSFAHLYEPAPARADQTTPPKYEVTGLFPQEGSDALVAKIRAVIEAMLAEKYGAKVPADFTMLLSEKAFGTSQKLFLRDGDLQAYDGYANHWSLKASNRSQPKLLDGDKSVLTADSGKLYSGSYAALLVKPWLQDNVHGKRINCEVLGVQHLAHGEAFGAGGPVPDSVMDEFEAVEPEQMDGTDLGF